MDKLTGRFLLDTNVLLLWLVARTDARMLREFKRVQEFRFEDIETLRALIQRASAFVSTPHVLSETSNFIDQAPAYRRPLLIGQLKLFVEEIAEIYEPARELIAQDEFNLLGLTDTGLASLSKEGTILTTDHKLAGKIESMGGNVVNFNHYRLNLLR